MLEKALGLDEILTRHSTIMDKYDPAKRVTLIVDEWGSWYLVEKGTNPGFLYQQNTIRDALIAAVSFHIFHKHADRVRMANIAQTVNVLQSVLLTDGAKMVATPTYHVFEMFAVHQGAQALAIDVKSETWEFGGKSLPRVSASASKNDKGTVHISLANLDPESTAAIEIDLRGFDSRGASGVNRGAEHQSVQGRVLTSAKMDDHNDFAHPETVSPKDFKDFTIEGGMLRATLPARSVIVLAIA
jgi:alpha-L-arabinofuranosidase